MVKPIVLEFEDGTEYTLEFNRESVKYAEDNGFNRNDVQTRLMTRVPELFYYAFRMHHPTLRKDKTDKILFEDMGGLSEEVLERLVMLFNEPYEALANVDGKPKNAKMTVKM